MKNIVKDMERFTEAENTIEELLPNVRGYLVMAMDKEKNGILAQRMWQFISGQNVSTRLKNVVGLLATSDMTVLEFIEAYPKMKFVKSRNCGKETVRELERVFQNNLVHWK